MSYWDTLTQEEQPGETGAPIPNPKIVPGTINPSDTYGPVDDYDAAYAQLSSTINDIDSIWNGRRHAAALTIAAYRDDVQGKRAQLGDAVATSALRAIDAAAQKTFLDASGNVTGPSSDVADFKSQVSTLPRSVGGALNDSADAAKNAFTLFGLTGLAVVGLLVVAVGGIATVVLLERPKLA